MKKHGHINETVFSIWVDRTQHNESRATYGGYDLEKYAAPGAEIEWHDINKNQSFWEVVLQNLTLSNSLNPKAEKQYVLGSNGQQNMIVDSGTAFIMMPNPDIELLLNYLNYEQGIGCYNGRDFITCECANQNYIDWFPDFTLHIKDKPYFIPKEQYVYK